MWLRLRQIALIAQDLEAVLDDLRAVFGLEIGHVDPGVETFGLRNAILPIGSQFLEVVSPIRTGTAGGRQLERRGGDGGYMVITQCDDHVPRKARVAELGVRKVLELDGADYRCMQLHPRDTGGSFLEIDWHAGGEDPGGDWEPAGHDWRKAVRTDRIRAIRAAEVQAEDPAAVARRWSEITEIPLAETAGGPALALQNATVRFVPIADGRGEGLGGIDVAVTDGGALRAAARERGCLVAPDRIDLCGTRFGLVEA
jgi:hypothetical protein